MHSNAPAVDATDPRPPLSDERERRARLANMRQELLAPVSAIIGYAEILLKEAGTPGLEEVAADLERIHEAAVALLELVDRLLDVAAVLDREVAEGVEAVQSELRHDLRNPLNVIKGYAELILEDIDAVGGGSSLRADLERLLDEADNLLAQLDAIVDFTRGRDRPAAGDGGDGGGAADGHEGAMVAGLLRLIGEPKTAVSDRPVETGRILVVDDNASNRRLLIRRLEIEGHSVVEADSGRKALQILAGERIDLVLLDLLMPEMNGFEVLQRLKSDDQLREIPVIMISGLQEMASVIRCIELGAEDFLPKPFDPVLLKARITASLERKRWHDRERHYLDRLESEKEKVEALLHNILPGRIVSRLSDGEAVIADRFDDVTILFCDIVNFTALASRLPSAVVVARLNNIFSEFDALTRRLQVEKIKTIGDAYMAAAGLPEPRPDHAEVMAELAFGMLEALERINRTSDDPLKVRIGIHTGPVVAGVIGTHKFIYDVWGDTVNIAARLEAYGIPDKVHISAATRRSIVGRFRFEPRDVDNIKGVGKMSTFLLTRDVELKQQPQLESAT